MSGDNHEEHSSDDHGAQASGSKKGLSARTMSLVAVVVVLVALAISIRACEGAREEEKRASNPVTYARAAATTPITVSRCGAPVDRTAPPLTDTSNPDADANFSEFVPGRDGCTQGVAGADSLRIRCMLLDGTIVDMATGRCASGIRGAWYGSRSANSVPITVSFSPS